MKKRTAVKIISFSAAFILIFAGIAVKTKIKNDEYRLEIENGYARCIDDLSAGLNNISLTLKKIQYVTTPKEISSMAAQLLSQAEVAKNAIAQLPQNSELTAVNKFLSQVGNYAVSVSESLINGEAITEEAEENISVLSETADKVAQIINETELSYNNVSDWVEEIDSQVETAADTENLGTLMGEIEDSFDDYPTLVYDGPYSDHILEKEPLMLKDAEEVTEGEALSIAALTADVEEASLQADGSVMGNIPSYRFSGQGITVTVSMSGGYPVFMRKERVVSDSVISYEQAVEKAKRYLTKIGMKSFTETYYAVSEGICVVNFAYLDGETICYTDLVKVGIAMDTGETMFYEASGYISNHTDRAFETPEHSAEEAKEVLNKKLTLKKTALTLIPTSGDEKRCYEFTCEASDGTEILVYINTRSLAEEDVLILLKSDGGTLVK